MPGVVAVLTGADLLDIDPYWGHAIKDRPIVAIDRVRFAGEPVAAVAAVDEATAAGRRRGDDRGRVRGAARRGHPRRRRSRPTRRWSTTAPLRPGLFHGLGTLPPRDGNVCYRYGIDRGDVDAHVRGRGHRGRGRVHVPGRLPVRDGDPQRHRPVGGRTGSRMWATCQHPFLVRAEIAALFDLPLGKVRIVVPYLGGGFGSKSYTKMEPITVALARKAGRPVKIVNRVAESMVTTRRHGAQVRMRTAADADRPAAGARRGHRLRYRRLRRQRPAGDRHRRRCGARARTAGTRSGSMRCASTPTPRRRARIARSARRTSSGWASSRWTRSRAAPASMRSRSGGATCCTPGEQVRPGGKPLDADLVGDVEKVAAALGWDRRRRHPDTGRGLSVGLLAAGAHPVSSARSCAWRRTARPSCSWAPPRWARASAPRSPRSRPRCWAWTRSASAAWARTPASRPTTAPRAPAARPRSPGSRSSAPRRRCARDLLDIAAQHLARRGRRTSSSRDGAAWCGDERRTLPGAHREALRAVRRPAHRRGRRAPGGHRLVRRGARLLGGVHRRRGGARGPRDRRGARSRARRPSRTWARPSTPSSWSARTRAPRCRASATRCSRRWSSSEGLLLNDDLLEYRIPTTDGPAGPTRPASSSRTATARVRSGPRAAARAPSRASSAAIATAVADAGVPITELPLTPERVWSASETQPESPRRRRNRRMTHVQDASRSWAPAPWARAWARCSRERATRSPCTTPAPRRSSGPRRATTWRGACSTGSRRPSSRAARCATRATSRTRSRAPSS